MGKSLTILATDELNGVTTFGYTLAKAYKGEADNTAEVVVLNPVDSGYISEFKAVDVIERTAETSYEVVFINNRAGLKWCIENDIIAERYLYFVHSLPVDTDLQKEVLPPAAVSLARILEDKVEVVVFSEKAEDYLEGLGYDCTKVNNAIDLTRFESMAPPTTINKILLFDLRNNLIYRSKLQNLANVLPQTYLRAVSVPNFDIQEEIAAADLVIAYGRSAIESMAMGKPTIIYGENGGDGLVTTENKTLLASTNFSGWSVRSLPVPEYLFEATILEEIQRYSQTDMTTLRDQIRTEYSDSKLLVDLNLTSV